MEAKKDAKKSKLRVEMKKGKERRQKNEKKKRIKK